MPLPKHLRANVRNFSGLQIRIEREKRTPRIRFWSSTPGNWLHRSAIGTALMFDELPARSRVSERMRWRPRKNVES